MNKRFAILYFAVAIFAGAFGLTNAGSSEVTLQFEAKPRPETVLVPVKSLDSLIELELHGNDPEAEKALNRFLEWVPTQIEHNRLFVRLSAPVEGDDLSSQVLDSENFLLRTVVRLPGTGLTTCVENIDFKKTYYRQEAPVEPGLVGHCGHIGVLQSMIEMGLNGPWTKGDNLNGDEIREMDKEELDPGANGLTNDDIADAHKRLMRKAGKPNPYCDISGDFDLTNPNISLESFAKTLNEHVNDDEWDCGIAIEGTLLTVPQAGQSKREPFWNAPILWPLGLLGFPHFT